MDQNLWREEHGEEEREENGDVREMAKGKSRRRKVEEGKGGRHIPIRP